MYVFLYEERMIKMEENKQNRKKKIKATSTKIAGRIIAALMVVFMLLASCSTALYFIINSK